MIKLRSLIFEDGVGDEAKKRGLQSIGFGRYVDPSDPSTVVAKSVGGRLVRVDPQKNDKSQKKPAAQSMASSNSTKKQFQIPDRLRSSKEAGTIVNSMLDGITKKASNKKLPGSPDYRFQTGGDDAQSGKPPASSDFDYVAGYASGVLQKDIENHSINSPYYKAYREAGAGKPPSGKGGDYTRGYLLGMIDNQIDNSYEDED